ncbi:MULTISPECIES: RNA 2'-phosphotransferase [unclassified Mesorhizobium]|uniref:RNA 2'-phosphotransferase n=1 Tax=unclassified Mesorhizobium TaxID=325217 RepID=UPI0009686836|nr:MULTISPECIES: RNA 2'-phosphotransferase [unclassified Mesorhizobium]MBN9256421.1 RNA 2'-phosphotransferase [Mesorhizobium sp.]OJX74675.1 MAG: RNA--NAD 2'-phosphotransferase [Mesorhizobium sp. 65-26]
MPNDTQISKFMSLVLRHAPQEAGLTLDENGWADLGALCAVIEHKFGASATDVARVVAENPKKRFAIEGDRIRAVQGHSVDIDLGLQPSAPPAILYHGTKQEFLGAILREGLTSQSRQHVHLSKDVETALIVARRRKGKDVILRVDSAAMAGDGAPFFLSDNGVWLTNHVPPRYLQEISERELP